MSFKNFWLLNSSDNKNAIVCHGIYAQFTIWSLQWKTIHFCSLGFLLVLLAQVIVLGTVKYSEI